MRWEKNASALALVLVMASPATAQVYGSLANFDVVNDNGHDCHGFEIEIEDSSYDRSKILSVFGLDRNFGVPPTSVVRYGAPTITDVPGFGVRVRYQAHFANGSWSTRTPSGPYENPGDSCWPFGNPQYDSGDLSCDHFGVSTLGTPAQVHYRWLCDKELGGHSGNLTPVPAEVPPVHIQYQPAPPPPPGQPPIPDVVEIQIDAPDAPDQPEDVFGRAYWVQVYSRHADHDVDLDQLMVDDPEVPGGDDEIETEWELFQEGGDNGLLGAQLFRDPADEALVLRFEFYEYVGALKADGEADCSGANDQHGPDDCGGLGDYVGAQMAAFDAAPVPEPGLIAQSIALLGLAGLARRRFEMR